jgi:hypothetical protein
MPSLITRCGLQMARDPAHSVNCECPLCCPSIKQAMVNLKTLIETRYEKAREMLRWQLNPSRVMTADEVDDHLDRLNPDLTVAAPLPNEASKPAPSATCSVSADCKWPKCRRDCVIKTDAAPLVEQDERGAFEAEFKMPVQCTRCDDGYAVTGYEAWDASAFILRWEGWQARAAYPSANVTQWESTAIANELWQLADQCGYEQFRDALSSHIKRAYQDGWQDRTTGVASVTYGEQK